MKVFLIVMICSCCIFDNQIVYYKKHYTILKTNNGNTTGYKCGTSIPNRNERKKEGKFYENNISWKMQKDISTYNYTTIRPVLIESIKAWAKLIKVTFSELEYDKDASISINFPSETIFNENVKDVNVLGICFTKFYETKEIYNKHIQSEILIKPGLINVKKNEYESLQIFQSIIVHEIGHALGLSHNEDGVDIMNAAIQLYVDTPLYRDSKRIIDIYGISPTYEYNEPCDLEGIVYSNDNERYFIFKNKIYQINGLNELVKILEVKDLFPGRIKIDSQFYNRLTKSYFVIENQELFEYKELLKPGNQVNVLRKTPSKIKATFSIKNTFVFIDYPFCFYTDIELKAIDSDRCEKLKTYSPLNPIVLYLRDSKIALSYINGKSFIFNGEDFEPTSTKDLKLHFTCVGKNNEKILSNIYDVEKGSHSIMVNHLLPIILFMLFQSII